MRIFGGAVLGGAAGALAGLLVAVLVLAKVSQLDARLVLEAHVGNGAIFGAIAGSVVGPILAGGPLSGISPRRYVAGLLFATSACAAVGYLFGNFIEVRAAINADPLHGSRVDVWMATLLLAEPVMGLLWATIMGIGGCIAFAVAIRRRRPGAW